ncbi:hypothetical protein VP01_999g6 [Puccinia sorghi]|uniref:Uncharacterized protein n=1 Tax=Puccinia sorghi TaxID=27349 RepID=A0A0L6U780_9BASI|nr:hypothetical protein VP01_999g6 [Puccinia sorghi]
MNSNFENQEISSSFQLFITNQMNQQSECLQAIQQALTEKDETIRQLLANFGNISLTNQQNSSTLAPNSSSSKKQTIAKNTPPSKGKAVKCTISGPSKLGTPKSTSKSNTSTPIAPTKTPSGSATKKITPKKPNQVIMAELPHNFNKTKPEILREFYARFSDPEQIQNVADNSCLPPMIP